MAPGNEVLGMGGIERYRSVVGRRLAIAILVPNNGNMEPPGFLPTLTPPCPRNTWRELADPTVFVPGNDFPSRPSQKWLTEPEAEPDSSTTYTYF